MGGFVTIFVRGDPSNIIKVGVDLPEFMRDALAKYL